MIQIKQDQKPKEDRPLRRDSWEGAGDWKPTKPKKPEDEEED